MLGILLFLLVAMDITKTTFSTRGGGMLTSGLSRLIWHTFFLLARGRGQSRLLEYAGQTAVLSVLLSWIACLWLSLFLMLLSDPGSVVDGTTQVAANLWETLYYAGFTLSTLGVGDYAASSDGWRVLTSVAAFCGLTFITAAITYIVPVLSAVSLQNQLSLFISSMGRTPQDILINSWNGRDFSACFENATDLRQMLVEHTLNHHAYPVIHCYHNRHAGKNIIPAFATFDEAMRLLDYVSTQVPQDGLKRRMLRSALDQYLVLQRTHYLAKTDADMHLPPMQLAALQAAGIPLKPADQQPDPRKEAERRVVLSKLLRAAGWHWTDIYGNATERAG
ncbi:potassium channel family protein [Stutzerimonas urumqiensis]|uniref:potassium channel family protein n=1 Tax=Stutzerimonas urumqiensis TaxID=638269 RepID=UPI003BAC14C7